MLYFFCDMYTLLYDTWIFIIQIDTGYLEINILNEPQLFYIPEACRV